VSDILIIIYACCSAALITYGLHHYFVIWLFLRAKNSILDDNTAVGDRYAVDPNDAPQVLSQIPLYNESTVAERIIRSVAEIDYPNHVIQVLDDSDDETIEIVDEVVNQLKAKGIRIEAIRREKRSGFKAGALDYGLSLNSAPYIAIFDSDFVPPKDFLYTVIPHFSSQKKCGVVQARWGHLNEGDTAFTRAQSVGINGHFIVEQVARSYNDYFLNFNGTAGVWSRKAIDDAGGWTSDTLTEDLDLSYRAQLRGWKFHFLPELSVPAELPPLLRAFRNQQFRWAKGSMQTAKKILPQVWKSEEPLRKKIEATFHLTHYSIHFCMFIQALLGLPIVLLNDNPFHATLVAWFAIPIGFAMIGPSLLYLIAERWLSKEQGFSKFITRLPMLLLIGFGVCLSNARACMEGIIGIKSPFVRTPKQGDNKKVVRYKGKKSYMPYLEIALSLYTFYTAYYYASIGIIGVVPFFLLYAFGFGMFGLRSWSESRIQRVVA